MASATTLDMTPILVPHAPEDVVEDAYATWMAVHAPKVPEGWHYITVLVNGTELTFAIPDGVWTPVELAQHAVRHALGGGDGDKSVAVTMAMGFHGEVPRWSMLAPEVWRWSVTQVQTLMEMAKSAIVGFRKVEGQVVCYDRECGCKEMASMCPLGVLQLHLSSSSCIPELVADAMPSTVQVVRHHQGYVNGMPTLFCFAQTM